MYAIISCYEARRLPKTFKNIVSILVQKRLTLRNLEAALGEETLSRLRAESEHQGGSQFRPHMQQAPSRVETLQRIRQEEEERNHSMGLARGQGRSTRLTGSVGINMGLDLEMRQ